MVCIDSTSALMTFTMQRVVY